MISERTFLMKIFARDDASKEMREMIIKRCEELDEQASHPAITILPGAPIGTPYPRAQEVYGQQAPSMQRLMQQNPDIMVPTPVTPAAAQALAARNALINGAGKSEEGRKTPRKM